MKKILSVCVMIMMVLSLSITAFAAPGAFVSSPSGNNGPTLVESESGDENCTAEAVVTPYGGREKLDEDDRAEMEDAYDKIVDSEDVSDLNEDIEKLAKDNNISTDKLAVSDLFNVDLRGCEEHENHKNYQLVVDADGLDNFVGLLAVNENGEFVLIKDAKIVNNGQLKFTVGDYRTFAIVVDTSDVAPIDPPQTGDNLVIYIAAAVASVALVAVVVVLIVAKRKKENA